MVEGPVTVLTVPTPALAHSPPAGGASLEEVLVAAVFGALLVATGVAAVVARRRGGLASLDRVAALAGRLGGLPGWAAVPMAVAGGSLLVAVTGFYWDVATHIDHGRDEGVFSNVAHWPILVGLLGLAVAGILSLLLADDGEDPAALEPRPGWRLPVGGGLLLLCGLVAVAGFPIDDVWHRLFGQDVTLWSPPHIQMVAGASLCTLALWVLLVEAERSRPAVDDRERRSRRLQEVLIAGAVLVGMSTLQGEFDFGVPQFRLLYQPVLIAIAAGVALVPARLRLGRGGALLAVAVFLGLRGALTLFVTGAMGHLTFHAPLYLGAAVAVELVALRVATSRQVTFGALAGLGIGTVGLGTEAVWSHIWMPTPWTAALLPEAAFVAVPAAVAAGLVGGLLGRALATPVALRQPAPRGAAVLAGAVLVAALAYPLPTTGTDVSAELTLEPVDAAGGDHARVTVALDPADAAEGAEWLQVIAWQGATWGRDEHTVLDELERVGEGTYRTTRPIPVDGEWKAMVRLHDGRVLAAAPIFLPEDEAIPAEEVPAEPQVTRAFVPDHEILLREQRPVAPWLHDVAYTAMALIAAVWLAAFAAAARRLRTTIGGSQPARERVGVR